MTLVVTTFAGCTQAIPFVIKRLPDPPRQAQHADAAVGYTQSPALEQQARLPPVDQRLPAKPVKVPVDGQYNTLMKLKRFDFLRAQIEANYIGTENGMNSIPISFSQQALLPTLASYLSEPVIIDTGGEITGNVFLDWKVESGGLQHMITLREGLCWSDGTLVTAYDIQFALDVFASQELFYTDIDNSESRLEPRVSRVWALGGQSDGLLPHIEVLGNHSLRITCAAPDPGLALRAAHAPNGYFDIIMPSVFLQNFHIDYIAKKSVWSNMRQLGSLSLPTEAEVEAARQRNDPDMANPDPKASWAVLFWKILDQRIGSMESSNASEYHTWAKNIPTLSAYMLPDTYQGIVTKQFDRYDEKQMDGLLLVRNPFYWEVDTANQQLPYYDEMQYTFRFLGWNAQSGALLTIGQERYVDNRNTSLPFSYAYQDVMNAYMYISPRIVWTNEYMDFISNPMYAVMDGWDALDNIRLEIGVGLRFNEQRTMQEWQTAIQDRSFRTALSAAIDRQTIVSNVFGDRASVSAWVPGETMLPQAYQGLRVPILLQTQDFIPMESYHALTKYIVADLRAIGLDAYLMDELSSMDYVKGKSGTEEPALVLTFTPSENAPDPFHLPIVPFHWRNATADPMEQAYATMIEALPGTDIEVFVESWQTIGDQVTALQPYVPLIDNIEAVLFRAPRLQGNAGDFLTDQYGSLACWWSNLDGK